MMQETIASAIGSGHHVIFVDTSSIMSGSSRSEALKEGLANLDVKHDKVYRLDGFNSDEMVRQVHSMTSSTSSSPSTSSTLTSPSSKLVFIKDNDTAYDVERPTLFIDDNKQTLLVKTTTVSTTFTFELLRHRWFKRHAHRFQYISVVFGDIPQDVQALSALYNVDIVKI